MIRTIVADDHRLVRAGLVGLLKNKKDIEVIAEAGTAEEAIRLSNELKPDLLLLDLDMPDLDGIEATKRIVSSNPITRVLILTMHENEEYAIRVLRVGASGFIVKGISPEELAEAIRKVARGEIFITESIIDKLNQRHKKGGDTENPLAVLSDRELQVFIRLARGMAFNRIADELGLSTSTAATYKSRIMEKLSLENNSEIVKLAIRVGLVESI